MRGAEGLAAVMSLSLIYKNLFDGQVKKPGDLERQRQARIVFAGLDRVHALARDAEPLGQIGLAPIALGAQDFEPVVQRRDPTTKIACASGTARQRAPPPPLFG